MEKLEIDIKQKPSSYPIYITHKDLSSLMNDVLEVVGEKKYLYIISQKVYKLYSKTLGLDKKKCFILKDGESEKNFNNLKKILEFMLKNKLNRKDYIIAIGGGVVGDITGFAASCYMRGINFIQIPTTLLAATDSSVGGKTAIDTSFGKNLIGAFYQPKAVFINVNFLKTLDEIQYKSGLGEVLKYAFIEKSCPNVDEPNLLNFLNDNIESIQKRNPLTLLELIKTCVSLKAFVVQEDEKETGLRRILNFGHTYAHAIETITNYKKFTHGLCVIEGIHIVLNLAYNLGLIDKEYKYLCTDLIKKYNFNRLPQYNIDKMISIMKSDKKNESENITFILPCGYAQVKEWKLSPKELKLVINGGKTNGITQ